GQSGAAEKAVPRQNEFSERTQLGETAYAAFVDAKRAAWDSSGWLWASPPSVSHAAGHQARASRLANEAQRLFLVPQSDPLGHAAHDLWQRRLASRAFPGSPRLFCFPASAREATGRNLGRISAGAAASAHARVPCL